ncbi:MAG: cell division protein FtsZ [Alloprevotella sp.]|nr:cell division protein FtsZ [Alloprevotella sp.]MBR1653033.1 cell division protein FtsZ [Alloprevotella sp.]MBR1653222.1 cell division protein FtsZ [Alloprevotella sp.]
MDNLIDMGAPASSPSIIKVIGVGGGGGNATNHMYRQGINEVNFLICNTDRKALQDSPIPNRLQLGSDGLGAGNQPELARKAAEESIEEIHRCLNDGTKMVFITAGMGGGTGTGAAPVIAREAKSMGILTVGIVTIPFRWEGEPKIIQALNGVEQLAKNVDALLVINNERLLEIYPDYSIDVAFEKADDTLSIAARSIVEIIGMHGKINLDFKDVQNFLKDGGVAIMSSGFGEGENRLSRAIDDALNSPLLNNTDIYRSKKVLLLISYSNEENGEPLMAEEMSEVASFMSKFKERNVITKWGLRQDASLGKKVKITILATGFGSHDIPGMSRHMEEIEEERLKAEQEEDLDNQDRIISYYGHGRKQTRNGRGGVLRTFLFNTADLDNEEVVALVEVKPTIKRTKEDLKEIESKTVSAQPVELEPSSLDSGGYIIGGF